MLKAAILVGAVAFLAPVTAQAADPGQSTPPMSYGAGVKSCGTWLADRRENGVMAAVDTAWLLGWVSAAGYYDARGNLRHTDSDAIAAWVDKFCREHPLDDISIAAAQLVETLAKQE